MATMEIEIDDGGEHMVDANEIEDSGLSLAELDKVLSEIQKPNYAPLSAQQSAGKVEFRKISVPTHRYTPLKENWLKIYTPIVNNMKLQIRMNTQTRHVELRTSEYTEDSGAIQKAADFIKAFMLGFEVDDAIALLRLDDIYIDSFDVTDVKTLKGDHLSRAIGRIAGHDGKTKFTIENVTKTRIVLADNHIHILGSFTNVKLARDAICSLILGSPPGKVYARMRALCQRLASTI